MPDLTYSATREQVRRYRAFLVPYVACAMALLFGVNWLSGFAHPGIWEPSAISAFFLGVFLIVIMDKELRARRVEVATNGLTVRRMLTRPRVYLWSEIEGIAVSSRRKARLRFRDYDIIKITLAGAEKPVKLPFPMRSSLVRDAEFEDKAARVVAYREGARAQAGTTAESNPDVYPNSGLLGSSGL